MGPVEVTFTFYITLDVTTFNNSLSAERDYEYQILLCQILIVFRHGNNPLH